MIKNLEGIKRTSDFKRLIEINLNRYVNLIERRYVPLQNFLHVKRRIA